MFLLHFGSFSQNDYSYIEYDSVVYHIPEVIALQEILDLEIKEAVDSLIFRQGAFESFITTQITCSHRCFNFEQARYYESKITELETNLSVNCDSVRQRINRLQAANNDLFLELVVSKIQCFSELNEIVYLQDRSSVLYCEDCCDYTFQFLEFLKEN